MSIRVTKPVNQASVIFYSLHFLILLDMRLDLIPLIGDWIEFQVPSSKKFPKKSFRFFDQKVDPRSKSLFRRKVLWEKTRSPTFLVDHSSK